MSHSHEPGPQSAGRPLGDAEMRGDETPTTLLLVDDSEPLRDRLSRALRDRGFDVSTAANYDEAMELARHESPELAVIDLRMPGRSGLELLRDLLEVDPSTKVLVLTGFGSIATVIDAIHLGAVNYLTKPANADEILAAFQTGEDPVVPLTSEALDPPTLAQAEWEHIHRVLAQCNNNLSETARLLGIHRRSLQRKLKKLAP